VTEVTSAIEIWTPAKAKEALESNIVNRALRPRSVSSYQKEMETGRWQMAGEPIKFSVDGKLLDGQHRLTALANAAVESIEFVVVRGLAPESQIVMDSGAARTAADALSFAHPDLKNKPQCAAIARQLTIAPLPGPDLLKKSKISNASVTQTFEDHPREISDAAAHGRQIAVALQSNATAIGYCWYQFAQRDADACRQFFNSMLDLTWDSAGDPRKAAYKQLELIARKPTVKTGGLTSYSIISVLTRAWNDWRLGIEVSGYKIKSNIGSVEPVVPK
jgi:hypothetical protein